MKAQSPALSPATIAAAAGRKAEKVHRKLKQAEAELHTANGILVKAVPTRHRKDIDAALEQNIAAEEKVHDATEELEVVKELLAATEPGPAIAVKKTAASPGHGEGAKSLIPHLERTRSGAAE